MRLEGGSSTGWNMSLHPTTLYIEPTIVCQPGVGVGFEIIFTTSKSPICFRVDFNSNWFWFSISLLLYLLFPCFFLHDSIVLWLVIWLVIFSLVVYYSRNYVGSNNISCWTEVQRYYYDPRHHSYPPPLSIRVKLVFISKACPYFFLKHVVQFIVQVNHSA